MRRKIIRSALIAFGLLIAVLAAYVIYVFADYHRFEDRLVLTPEGEASASLETDTVYRAVSYNVGFGAYSADYSFFMDGGTESRYFQSLYSGGERGRSGRSGGRFGNG